MSCWPKVRLWKPPRPRHRAAEFCYRVSTSFKAIVAVLRTPSSDIENFLAAYEFLELDGDESIDTDTEVKHIENYYKVLNRFISIGDLEKMYIPPILDPKLGVIGNQLLSERRMCDALNIGPGSAVLDVGCGKGRIAHHVAMYSGATVFGFNIDATQIQSAEEYARRCGLLGKQLHFEVRDFHKGFPYADSSFDAVYQIGAVPAYCKRQELVDYAREVFRVLKPGGRMSSLDYHLLPAYDPSNPHHRHLRKKFKPVMVAVHDHTVDEMLQALQTAGLHVRSHGAAGAAIPLVEGEAKYFQAMQRAFVFLGKIRVLSPAFGVVLQKINQGGDALVSGEKLGLLNMNYNFIAEKL